MVLVVDDDESVCRLLATLLDREGFAARTVTSARAAVAALATGDVDAIVTDVMMDDADGLALCARVLAEQPELPVVVMTSSQSFETALGAIRAGAFDYLTKPVDPALLGAVLRRATRRHRLAVEVEALPSAVSAEGRAPGALGVSPAMEHLRTLLVRVAAADTSVLITGESGTGKELIARAIHDGSARRDGPFLPVNCAAIPGPLLESELFGHARGAFTDAHTDRAGLFAQAAGGTVFLDEIAELPVALQPKLLRALQERRIRPVGADREVTIDVRFVAATNRDMRTEIAERRFRDDLWYRLAVIEVHVPPLRARGHDVLLLAQHFLERHARRECRPTSTLTAAAAERLLAYPWPGNVRELENCIERAHTLTRHDRIGAQDLPPNVRAGWKRDDAAEPALLPLAEVERRHVRAVLDAVGGNASQAARILGIDRKTLARKMRPAERRSGASQR